VISLESAQNDSFVLLQLAEQRFALPAGLVAELAPPVRLHSFPHTSPHISGVIVRRGRILPVYDAARALSGKSSFAHRFYLVARRQFGETSEMTAIPVDGECELVTSDFRAPANDAASYISGEITAAGESIGILDIESLIQSHSQPTGPTEARQ